MPVDLIHEKEFASRLIRPDTWIITGHPVSAVTYLRIGGHTALVIDPGEHVRNLRDYVRTITDLPLIVANTHAHGDHTACNGQFKEYPIYASAGAVEELGQKRVDPNRYTTEVRYDYDYQALPIGDGHVFDLGGRRVRAIAAGCHSEGSLFYYDEKYQLLFTGDELECGQVLIRGSIHGARHSVERYRDNLLKVKRAAGRVDLVCPEHNGSPARRQRAGRLHRKLRADHGRARGRPQDQLGHLPGAGRPARPGARAGAAVRPLFAQKRVEGLGAGLFHQLHLFKRRIAPRGEGARFWGAGLKKRTVSVRGSPRPETVLLFNKE